MIFLKNCSIRQELEILLCHVLQVERYFLKAHPEKLLSNYQIKKFYKLVTRRLQHEPIAYITGTKHFWDLNLLVNRNVLIPRSETEILVEQALAKLSTNSSAKILELGTGSGAVALSIAKHRPNTTVYATDLSTSALKLAKRNAKALNINNIIFFSGDWFKALPPSLDFKFDLIISNPPYIAAAEVNLCDQEIFYEPKLALFADNNGLACLKKIIFDSVYYLANNGYLLLEHGYNQAIEVANMLKKSGLIEPEYFKDLSSLDRVVVAKKVKYT
ncbi:MAG: peptide chain release factor N(5)-glutamine methyltransferase [Gammaproteobacteria bacterium]|jgi:release factor glutamine methyltransferase